MMRRKVRFVDASLSGVGVLDKAVALLRAVADRPLGLGPLASATGMPRATTHRLAVALEVHGLIRRDAEGRFALGLGLVGLGRAAAEAFPLREAASAALAELRDDTGESVQLYVVEGGGRRCVTSLQSPHGLRWIVPEGALLPLGVGSAGKVLAGADSGPAGWIASVEEREVGVCSVSAPVHDPDGAVVAAVSVSGPVERLGRDPGARHGAAVVRAARAVEARRVGP
jgi:DNA-binding IclR family transcriptional regulator